MKSSEAIEIVSDLASQQWGLVTAAQAKACRVDQPSLHRLAKQGVLVRIRHGVYATGTTAQSPELEIRAHWLALQPEQMAADRTAAENLAEEAVVSHETAAELWGIGDLWQDGIHFTVAGRRQSRQADVRFHRGVLTEEEWTQLQGLPVTTVARTIADLARVGHEPEHLLALVADAARKQLVNRGELMDQLAGEAKAFDVSSHSELRELIWQYFPESTHSTDDFRLIADAVGESLWPRLQDQLSALTNSMNSAVLEGLRAQAGRAASVAGVTENPVNLMTNRMRDALDDITQSQLSLNNPVNAGAASVFENQAGAAVSDLLKGGRLNFLPEIAPATIARSAVPDMAHIARAAELTTEDEEDLHNGESEDDPRADHKRAEDGSEAPGNSSQ